MTLPRWLSHSHTLNLLADLGIYPTVPRQLLNNASTSLLKKIKFCYWSLQSLWGHFTLWHFRDTIWIQVFLTFNLDPFIRVTLVLKNYSNCKKIFIFQDTMRQLLTNRGTLISMRFLFYLSARKDQNLRKKKPPRNAWWSVLLSTSIQLKVSCSALWCEIKSSHWSQWCKVRLQICLFMFELKEATLPLSIPAK